MLKSSLRVLTFAVTAALAATAVVPTTAAAITLPGPYKVFEHCPYTNPNIGDYGNCLYNETTSGAFTIGSTTLPIDSPIVLQGGLTVLNGSPLYDAVGAPTLSSPPGHVPGGLLGIVNPAPDWPFPLWVAFWSIVNSVNDVTATMELVAPVQTTFIYALYPPTDGSDPAAATLPLRVRLSNPFLGNTCFIGSAQNPILVKLQTATTNPPPPNQPISGNTGVYNETVTDETNYYSYVSVDGSTLVDNSFAVPAAKGCGNIALGLPILTPLLDFLVSGAVNLKVGLPSASGKNTAVLNGNSRITLGYVVAGQATP